jgi:hypothetical protein
MMETVAIKKKESGARAKKPTMLQMARASLTLAIIVETYSKCYDNKKNNQ